jgi:hypothetical protein
LKKQDFVLLFCFLLYSPHKAAIFAVSTEKYILQTVGKHILKHAQGIPVFRRWLGYVLLVCFLNTIVFPAIHVPVAIKKWQSLSSTSDCNTSLTEYILEDCLQIEDRAPAYPEEDVEDVLKTTDDLDLLDHMGLNISFAQLIKKNNTFRRVNQLLVHTFYSSPTPPPEFQSVSVLRFC